MERWPTNFSIRKHCTYVVGLHPVHTESLLKHQVEHWSICHFRFGQILILCFATIGTPRSPFRPRRSELCIAIYPRRVARFESLESPTVESPHTNFGESRLRADKTAESRSFRALDTDVGRKQAIFSTLLCYETVMSGPTEARAFVGDLRFRIERLGA